MRSAPPADYLPIPGEPTSSTGENGNGVCMGDHTDAHCGRQAGGEVRKSQNPGQKH